MLGVLISAAYAIRTIGRLFTGPVFCEIEKVPDLKASEMFAASVLSVGILVIGFYPTPAINLISASIADISLAFTGPQ